MTHNGQVEVDDGVAIVADSAFLNTVNTIDIVNGVSVHSVTTVYRYSGIVFVGRVNDKVEEEKRISSRV